MSEAIVMGTADAPARVPVWDPLVRLFHWSVVVGVALNLFVLEEGKYWHRTVGYAIAIAFALRLIWGFVGPRHARWSDFFPWPSRVLAELRGLLHGSSTRHLGHSPLAGLMIVAFFLLVAGLTASGWLLRTDWFWGSDTMEEIHEVLGNGLMVLAALHALSAIVQSLRCRENLVLAMITGKKRP